MELPASNPQTEVQTSFVGTYRGVYGYANEVRWCDEAGVCSIGSIS